MRNHRYKFTLKVRSLLLVNAIHIAHCRPGIITDFPSLIGTMCFQAVINNYIIHIIQVPKDYVSYDVTDVLNLSTSNYINVGKYHIQVHAVWKIYLS